MYRGNKKFARRQRRIHREHKDKRSWWQDEDYVWEPSHMEAARQRIKWKRDQRRREREGWSRRWNNDFGVSQSARKRKFHRRHEIKPYTRPTKT